MKIQKHEFKFTLTERFYFIVIWKIVKYTDLHIFEDINQFPANVSFLYSFIKITDVFMGYRIGALAGDSLRKTYTSKNFAI